MKTLLFILLSFTATSQANKWTPLAIKAAQKSEHLVLKFQKENNLPYFPKYLTREDRLNLEELLKHFEREIKPFLK